MICISVLVLVLALFAFTACNNYDTEEGTELLTNGDFEDWDSDDKAFEGWSYSEDWTKSEYGMQPLSSDSDLSDMLGTQYLYIKNTSASYSYLYQSIKVDRNAVYEISVDVKIGSDLKKGSFDSFRGAYVGFLENPDYYFLELKTKTSSSNNGWVSMTFYVKPVNTDYLTLAISLGAEEQTASGTVYFDNASMKRIDSGSVPSDQTVQTFKKAKVTRYAAGDADSITFAVLLSVFSAAVLIAAYVLVRRNYAKPNAFVDFGASKSIVKSGAAKGKSVALHSSKKWWTDIWFIGAMLMLGAFALRLILLLTTYGFGNEMTFVANIAQTLGKSGDLTSVYTDYASLATTAPGALYILTAIGAITQGANVATVSVLIRLVNVLADMAVVAMIYFYGRKYVGNRLSTIYAALYAVLPLIFVISGMSNSFTSLTVALMLAAVILVVEKQYLPTYLAMCLAIVLDLRAFAIAPLLLAYMGYMYYKDDDKRSKFTKNRIMILSGLVASFVLVYLLTLPVSLDQIQAGESFYGYTVLVNLMTKNTLFVDNALNLYAMVGMNVKTTSNTVNILNLVFLLVLEIYVISLYVKNRNKQEIFLLVSFTFAVIAVFTLKVDFTYLMLSIAFGLIYTMISGDKRMYAVMSMYGVLALINVTLIVNNSGFFSGTTSTALVNFETTAADLITFSVFAVLTTLYYVYVAYSITNNSKIADIKPMPEGFVTTLKKWFGRTSLLLKSLAKPAADKKSE
jgi:hypothetical protein